MSTIHGKLPTATVTAHATSVATASATATAATTATTAVPWSTLTGVITSGSTITGLSSKITTLEASSSIFRLDPEQTDEVAFRLPWGKVVSIPQDELIKYIGERELRESNELVRTLWDRYQTAVKLIWSADDEQET